ncbi:hypothetical protein BpHYR1_010553 [Brachionus plicatilis]|uniref:Uncharacterized protein n=1 Tax=Brachionus plicatilis TaxID=10195 RepID=A0A3M7T8A8_BRAPC|nr:hypothetical protein BpHYR1_010553 [Brachionus plicatilis]
MEDNDVKLLKDLIENLSTDDLSKENYFRKALYKILNQLLTMDVAGPFPRQRMEMYLSLLTLIEKYTFFTKEKSKFLTRDEKIRNFPRKRRKKLLIVKKMKKLEIFQQRDDFIYIKKLLIEISQERDFTFKSYIYQACFKISLVVKIV